MCNATFGIKRFYRNIFKIGILSILSKLTGQAICRPDANQRILYNGHKRVHAIKFQALITPNGYCAHLR